MKSASTFFPIQWTGTRTFGASLTQYMELIRLEHLPPLRICLEKRVDPRSMRRLA